MASPALWSVYLDLLIKELRELGVGCHVGGVYMGAVVYVDDVPPEVQYSPCLTSVKTMLPDTV
jgi:hypothetical protein